MRRGEMAATRSSRMRLVTSSWNADVAVGPEVELQRLELDEVLVGHERDRHRGEVGLAGHRADARELGGREVHLVVTSRMRVVDGDEVLGR
jgi:hypothetical protein